MPETVAKRIFVGSGAFLLAAVVFAYGLAVGRFQLWPYFVLQPVWLAAKSYLQYGELVPEGRRMLAPPGASRDIFTINERSRLADGYYIFVGWDNETKLYSAWLYDETGTRRHTWRIDYQVLDPDGPLNGADHPHPFHVLQDGSVIVGFDDGDVMARIDVCSEPLWIKPGIYHHSLSQSEDGSLWVWRGDGTPTGHYNYMENFDPDTGKTIRELALIEDVIQNMGMSAVVFGVRATYPFRRFEKTPLGRNSADLFHPNDIDVLSSSFAPMFPMFEAGDLLLSFRNLNLITVVDPDDARVKWWSHGPWIGQHDPDFTSDGKISVYDNNTDRGRSEIIRMDPATKEISNDLYGGEVSFSSRYMGKHQYLPNGNVLIVVPEEGRVLEVTSHGRFVMEFNNLSLGSPEYNEHVQNGMWVPADYFRVEPRCVN